MTAHPHDPDAPESMAERAAPDPPPAADPAMPAEQAVPAQQAVLAQQGLQAGIGPATQPVGPWPGWQSQPAAVPTPVQAQPPWQLGWQPGGPAAGAPPPYAWAVPQLPTVPGASSALTMAILSWVLCPGLLALIALVVAERAGDRLRAAPASFQGQGTITAARVVAWANLAAVGLVVVLLLLLATVGGVAWDGGTSVEV